MNGKIKMVVFDLDDTLHDLRKYTFTSFYYVADRLSEEKGLALCSLYLSMCQKYDESWWRSQVFNRVMMELGICGGEGLIEQCRKWFHEAVHGDESLFRDTLPVLDSLKRNFKVGLLTDGPEKVQRKKIVELGILNFFDKIIVVEGNDEKPSPKGFLKICERLNLQPQETLFVGDNPYRDVAGALSVGMKVAWVRGTSVWVNKELPVSFFNEPVHELSRLIDILSLNFVSQ